ncbi:MAG: M20 family metallopeptidase [Anaerovoracaceae bacterium]
MADTNNSSLYELIDNRFEREKENLYKVSDYIFNHPELGGEEYESSKYLCQFMENNGFSVTHPCSELPTAFVAAFVPANKKKKGRVIGFIAEYDALPGFGENNGPGHACGHNWIAACMCGCALALSEAAERLGCEVRLIGTPAEETFGGKYDMIKCGVFDDVDVAFQAHLDEFNSIETLSLALNSVEFSFHGVAAHAAQNPEKGINALDAVISMYNNINALRQHMRDEERVHGIITHGGTAANTVPDFAQCRFSFRAKNKENLHVLRKKIINIAEAAALATGAELEYRDYENPFDDMINVPVLTSICKEHFKEFGYDDFIPEDRYPGSGSSDIGNVSYVCPTVYMEIAPKKGEAIIVHDKSAMALVNSSCALETMEPVVKTYVRAAIDICSNDRLFEQILDSYEKRKKSLTF